MKNGICPKCGSTEIVTFKPNKVAGDFAQYDYEYIGALKTIAATRYTCVNCGYSERYFEDKELEKLQKKYRK